MANGIHMKKIHQSGSKNRFNWIQSQSSGVTLARVTSTNICKKKLSIPQSPTWHHNQYCEELIPRLLTFSLGASTNEVQDN